MGFHEDCNELCGLVSDVSEELTKLIINHLETINSNEELKHIILYNMLLINYVDDLIILLRQQRYASGLVICRSIMECYTTAIELEKAFPNPPKYQHLIKILYAQELKNYLTKYKRLSQEISATTLKEEELPKYWMSIEHIIVTQFPDELDSNNSDKYECYLLQLAEKIVSKTKFYSMSQRMTDAINANTEFEQILNKAYQGSSICYNILCSSAHNSISSLLPRSLEKIDGQIFAKFNSADENLLPSLSLVFFSFKDIIVNLEKAFHTLNECQ